MSNRDDSAVGRLIGRARAEKDPRRRYALLLEAREMAPDSLAVHRALLMHGRLHERDGRRVDYSVIKCFLFHVFEHPERYDEMAQERAAAELLHGEQLTRCLTLSDDPDTFLREYLTELAGEYVRIFILPDRSHAPWAFGLVMTGRRGRFFARPAADVLRNILSCPTFSPEEQRLTARAFYRAYFQAMDGDVDALDALLGEDVCRQLA